MDEARAANQREVDLEEGLVRRARARSPEAWTQIYETNHAKLFRYVLARVGDQHIAEDLTATVFVEALKGIDSYVNRGRPLLAWLYTIARNAVNYDSMDAPTGSIARIRIGEQEIAAYDGAAAPHGAAAFDAEATAAIRAHGYPASADPEAVDMGRVIAILTVLVLYVTMVYGPIAAMLVELFPTRIRYSGMSLPYHIGNGWFGGFLPATAFAIAAATGSIYSGLYYPVVIALMTFVVGLFFVPETRDRDIYANDRLG